MLEGLRLMVNWAACGFALCGEASSAQDALRLMDTWQPHLLMCDVQMPGMSGTDLAAIANRYHPGTIILFFSGFRDFAYAQSAIRAHAFGYLTKPIDPDEVHETLLRVKAELDRRALEGAQADGRALILHDTVLRRIALHDDSAESLLRAGVLLQLKRGEPCYCAVADCGPGPVPEGAQLLLATCGAVPFHLAGPQYGLCFRQIDRNLPQLERLAAGLMGAGNAQVSVGNVYHGAEGFARSLREALDAQGVLFAQCGRLRLYHAFDMEAAGWLARVSPAALLEAALGERAERLTRALETLRETVTAANPTMFMLRYLAAALDAMLPTGTGATAARLRALWRDGAAEQSAWLDAFCDTLAALQAGGAQGADAGLPPPVQAVAEAVRTRYGEALSLAAVADELHMNPAYLGQLVRRHTGETFHRLLLKARIARASVLLRQTVRPVGEVAAEVGFRDVDYFSQQFRSRMGMSPVAYRSAEATRKEGAYATDQ